MTIHRSVSTTGDDISITINDFAPNFQSKQLTICYDPRKPDVIKVNNHIMKVLQ